MSAAEGGSFLATAPSGTRVPALPLAVTAAELAEWNRRGALVSIIDIREPREFQQRHLPEAQNLPLSKPQELVHRVPIDTTLVLVCGDGQLSSKAAETLRGCGLTGACFLQGGMSALSPPPSGSQAWDRRPPRPAPRGCKLILKPASWLSILNVNLALQWIEVSEEGIGVLVSRKLRIGEELRAWLLDALCRDAFDVLVVVRDVRESRSRPGCYVASCDFIDPSTAVRFCIRSVLDTGSLPVRAVLHAVRRMV